MDPELPQHTPPYLRRLACLAALSLVLGCQAQSSTPIDESADDPGTSTERLRDEPTLPRHDSAGAGSSAADQTPAKPDAAALADVLFRPADDPAVTAEALRQIVHDWGGEPAAAALRDRVAELADALRDGTDPPHLDGLPDGPIADLLLLAAIQLAAGSGSGSGSGSAWQPLACPDGRQAATAMALAACWQPACPAMRNATSPAGIVEVSDDCDALQRVFDPTDPIATSPRNLAVGLSLGRGLTTATRLAAHDDGAIAAAAERWREAAPNWEIPLDWPAPSLPRGSALRTHPDPPTRAIVWLDQTMRGGRRPVGSLITSGSRGLRLAPVDRDDWLDRVDPYDENVLRSELDGPAPLGVLLEASATVGHLRTVLDLAETLGEDTPIAVALTAEDGERVWLVLEPAEGQIADALVQRADESLLVWIDPEKVSVDGERIGRADRGRRALVAAESDLRDSLLGIHEVFADTPTQRLTLDLDDGDSLASVLAIVDLVNRPRLGAHVATEALLDAGPESAAPKLTAVLLTRERARPVALTDSDRDAGVMLPQTAEIETRGTSLRPEFVHAALERVHAPLKHCFARAARRSPGLAGAIAAEVEVRADGGVDSVRVLGDSTASPLLAQCLEDALESLRFAPLAETDAFVATIEFASPRDDRAGRNLPSPEESPDL